MPDALTIRPARPGDADRLACLTGQLGYPAPPEAIQDRLDRLMAVEDQVVLVAEGDGEVVGWAQVGRGLTLESGAQAELVGLVVDEAWRGRGIGAALVAAAEDWARDRGLPRLRVRSNVTREATHRFYRNLGFEEAKRQVVFRKALA
ncbi:MAG TPA: GNAT family N-acetyltransferase [Holophagaceae bacterium]